MRKLTPARISYRDDFLISYRSYMMTGSFHISLFEGTLRVDKIHVWLKIANITHAHRNGWSIRVYMIRDFVLEWNSRPGTTTGVNSRWGKGDSRQHDILLWYHVNKYRAMRVNRSELVPARKTPRRYVNTPLGLEPVPVVCCNERQGWTCIETRKSWATLFKFQCNACKT